MSEIGRDGLNFRVRRGKSIVGIGRRGEIQRAEDRRQEEGLSRSGVAEERKEGWVEDMEGGCVG